MKTLYKQFTKKQWIVFFITLISTILFVASNSFTIVLLSSFINILANFENPSATHEALTLWDVALSNIVNLSDPSKSIWVLLGLTILFSVFGFIVKIITRIYLAKLCMQTLATLRNQIFHRILYLNETTFNSISPTSAINRVTNDMYELQEAAVNFFMYFYESVLFVVWNVIFSLTLSPLLTSIYLIFFPVCFVTCWISTKKADKYYDRNLVVLDKTNQVVRENILGLRVVKSFNLQKYQYRRFSEFNKEWLKSIIKSETIVMSGIIILFFILNVAILAILIFGGFIAKTNLFGGISVGVIVAFINYIFATIYNIFGITNTLLSLIRIFPVNRRIKEILNSKTENLKIGIIPNNFNADISFKNVCFKYENESNILTLDNINLDIKAGETVGIIGLTGSGKSTLVSLIANLYQPNSGEIRINDININDLNLSYLRSNIGFAPQEKLIFAGTIKSNILNGKLNATDEEIATAAKHSCAAEFINKLEYKYLNPVSQYGSNLSGGQKQRLSLSRALVNKPKILILDDTLSAVDNLTQETILSNLKNFYAKTTKIIVSQQIKTIKHADKIYVLENGKIIDSGTHDFLKKSCKLYQSIDQLQQQRIGN